MPRGRRLPIDFFFRSLAEELRESAICIVLSGTGSDGTLGLRAVKGQGGMVMAQDEVSAKYSGMPHSAIATGLVDYVLPAENMPVQLLEYVSDFAYVRQLNLMRSEAREREDHLQKIFSFLRGKTQHDFSAYKRNTIVRRIERRMVANHVYSLADYVARLQESPQEIDALFDDLLIGVTSFFRDPVSFAALQTKALPLLFDGKKDGEPMRIWVPGCATGEEAYSIGIVVAEWLSAENRKHPVQIFATDIDGKALETARQAVYPANIAADVSPERLRRFFTLERDAFRVGKSIRDRLIFAAHNLLRDPP
jgi:two-component system CheB/CheR fusion protein